MSIAVERWLKGYAAYASYSNGDQVKPPFTWLLDEPCLEDVFARSMQSQSDREEPLWDLEWPVARGAAG